jgi:hypothetical protein
MAELAAHASAAQVGGRRYGSLDEDATGQLLGSSGLAI